MSCIWQMIFMKFKVILIVPYTTGIGVSPFSMHFQLREESSGIYPFSRRKRKCSTKHHKNKHEEQNELSQQGRHLVCMNKNKCDENHMKEDGMNSKHKDKKSIVLEMNGSDQEEVEGKPYDTRRE